MDSEPDMNGKGDGLKDREAHPNELEELRQFKASVPWDALRFLVRYGHEPSKPIVSAWVNRNGPPEQWDED